MKATQPVSSPKNMQKRFRTAFKLLWIEGACAMAYETWLGPTYLSGLAGELGVSVGWLTLLITLPWIGSIGQVAGIVAYERTASVKKYTLIAASTARALWMFPFVLALYWGWKSWHFLEPFPTHRWFSVLAGTACLSALFASSSSVAWMSWMRGLLPSNFRGRFFGIRQSYVMIALTAANLFAFACIDWKPRGFFVGYGLVWAMALVSALVSTLFLARVPDARIRTSRKTTKQHRPLFEAIAEPFKNKDFLPVLLYGALFNGAIQMAGPFFPYYFTKELHIPMSSVAFWSVLSSLGCFLTAGFWGKKVDRSSHPGSVLWLACHMVSVSPLFYVFPSAALTRWIAPFDFFLSGVSWAGFFLAMTTLVFRAAPENKSAVYFSVYSAVAGLSCATFTWLGGRTVEWLAAEGGFRALWLLGASLRFVVIWSFVRSTVFRPVALKKNTQLIPSQP